MENLKEKTTNLKEKHTKNQKKEKISTSAPMDVSNMTLSEEEEVLRSSPVKVAKPESKAVLPKASDSSSKNKSPAKNTTHSENAKSVSDAKILKQAADMQAIRVYKQKVSSAKFFLSKSKQTLKSGGSLAPEFKEKDKESLSILQKEEERVKQGISYTKFLNLSVTNPKEGSSKRDRSMDDEKSPPAKRASLQVKFTKVVEKRKATPKIGESTRIEKRRGSEHSKHRPSTSKEALKSISGRPSTSKSPANRTKFVNAKPVITDVKEMSYSEMAKQTLKVCIVDANSKDLRMSHENFSIVEEKIQDAIVDRILKEKLKSFPSFHMKERFRGYRIINCENEFTLQFLKDTISNIGEPWSGAKLGVRHLHELPGDPIININLPVRHNDIKKITCLLACNNPSIPVDRWNLVAFGKNFAGRTPVRFSIDKDSLKLIEDMGNELNFGLRTVMVSKAERSKTSDQTSERIVSISEIQQDADISSLLNTSLVLEDVKEEELQ
jgi:hypothetical protein